MDRHYFISYGYASGIVYPAIFSIMAISVSFVDVMPSSFHGSWDEVGENEQDLQAWIRKVAVNNTLAETELCKLKHQAKMSGRASCKANQVGFVIPKKWL